MRAIVLRVERPAEGKSDSATRKVGIDRFAH